MAAEIQTSYTTAKTLKAIIHNSVGLVWQTTSSTFVAYVTANIANYVITMTEQGTASCYYTGTFPAAILPGVYSVEVFVLAGGSYAETDGPAISVGDIVWDGAAVANLAWLYRRFMGKTIRDKVGQTIKTYLADGTTVMATQTTTSTGLADEVDAAT